ALQENRREEIREKVRQEGREKEEEVIRAVRGCPRFSEAAWTPSTGGAPCSIPVPPPCSALSRHRPSAAEKSAQTPASRTAPAPRRPAGKPASTHPRIQLPGLRWPSD